MQRGLEGALTRVLTTAQDRWNATDNVTLGALINLLAYGMTTHFKTNDEAMAFLVQKLPHALRDGRLEYERALHILSTQGSA